MNKKKEKESDLERLGLGHSIVLFLFSWLGLLGSAFLAGLKIVELINNYTFKGLFFLPFYIVVVGLYLLMTFVFVTKIVKIRKKSKLERSIKK